MKTIFFSFLILSSFSIRAQEFMGVKVDGSPQQVIANFKLKGFVLEDNKPEDNYVKLVGKAGNTKVDLYAVFTPVSKKCWSFAIFLPEQSTWGSLKNQYKDYLNLFIEKYGQPNNKYDYFSDPYYEGDGYEMQAVTLEKCTYAAFWDNYSIQMTKFQSIKLQYENPENVKLKNDEQDRIDKNTF